MMVMALGETCLNNEDVTPDDGVVCRNILSFCKQILSLFVKPPSDTLLRYGSYMLLKVKRAQFNSPA
jgi:hypothetical protein